MLSELLISNFAIIDDLHLRFEPGFNVLTGETGAGKSIIIDAVSLLLGARGEVEYVRAGADQASIEAHFRVDGPVWERVEPLLERDELLGEDPGRLILAREIRRNGRNVYRRMVGRGPLGILLPAYAGVFRFAAIRQQP